MASERPSENRFDPRRVTPEGRFQEPRLYIVGEAPGAEETAQRRPFVGPAGRALREMLEQAAIDTRQLRLANAVPYRPVERTGDDTVRNRTPDAEEVRRWGKATLTDIRRSRPQGIVALGSTAARLFGRTGPIGQMRGKTQYFENRPLWITYHPAYVRRFGGSASALWRDTVADLRRAWQASDKSAGQAGA
jgi:DNA polymerase